MTRLFLGLAITLLLTPGLAADIINVPDDWPTVQLAINNSMPGDEIVIADGTYTGSFDTFGNDLDTDIKLTMKDRVSIDSAGAIMRVEGAVVTPVVQVLGGGEVEFRYVPPENFRFSQNVDVSMTISDSAVPPNQTVYSYSFRSADGNGTGGDIDGSGRVDGRDLAILAVGFGSEKNDARYRFDADIDGNGVIDGVDLTLVAATFGGRP